MLSCGASEDLQPCIVSSSIRAGLCREGRPALFGARELHPCNYGARLPDGLHKIGYLDANNLSEAGATLGRRIRSAGDIAELALAAGIAQVWLHPSAHAELGLPEQLPPQQGSLTAREGFPHPFVTDAQQGATIYPAGLSHWLVYRPHGNRAARLDIAIPAYDHASGLHDAPDGPAIVAAVRRYNELLRIAYRWSPGTAGADLLRATHQGPNSTRLERAGEPVPPALNGATETDFRWSRPPDLEERGRRWAYAFDANGLYLAACSSLELGFGEAEHYAPKRGGGEIVFPDLASPGYWRVRITPAPAGELDPFAPLPHDEIGEPRWYAAPSVALAVELGRLESVLEGYLFPRRHRFLSPWYGRLREARTALVENRQRVENGLALGLVKRTYTLTIGNLAGHFHEGGEPLHRPDWRHAIIATARANLYRRIRKLNLRPLAVDVDSLVLASDAPRPELVDPALPLGDALGQFTYEGRAPMADVIDAAGQHDGAGAIREVIRGRS